MSPFLPKNLIAANLNSDMYPWFFVSIGLFGYGNLLQNYASVYVLATFHGIMLFGILIGGIDTLGYAFDAFRDSSNEIFVTSMEFKNSLFYGMSYLVIDWLEEKGPAQMFDVLGGITIFLVCPLATWLILVFYVFGKQVHGFWARHVSPCYIVLTLECPCQMGNDFISFGAAGGRGVVLEKWSHYPRLQDRKGKKAKQVICLTPGSGGNRAIIITSSTGDLNLEKLASTRFSSGTCHQNHRYYSGHLLASPATYDCGDKRK
jgi:hypothetical protein